MPSHRPFDFPADAKLGWPEAQSLFKHARRVLASVPGGTTGAWLEFTRILRSIDLCGEESVDPRFIELLSRRFGPEVLERAGINVMGPHAALHLWRNPEKIALALFAFDMPVSDFVLRGAICHFPNRPSTDLTIARIHELAPAAIEKLKQQRHRITIWRLADHLGDDLGADFLSNFACLHRVRHALERYAESDSDYAERVIDLLYRRPIIFQRFRSFAEAIRSLGLNRVLVGRADLRQDLRLAFKKAQQTRAVTHRGTTGKRAPAAPAAPRLHSNAGALSRSYTAH